MQLAAWRGPLPLGVMVVEAVVASDL
jgi:hypothetical protein